MSIEAINGILNIQRKGFSMKKSKEEIKNLKEELKLKKEIAFEYQANARKIERESKILKEQISEIEKRIKRLQFVDARIHRVIPMNTDLIKVHIQNEDQETEIGNFFFLISYEGMDEEFKSLISILRFSHVFLQPDLKTLYWTASNGTCIKRELVNLI